MKGYRSGSPDAEGTMRRGLYFFATCTLALILCLPGHGQDSPSLGDLARQAQKEKTGAPTRKVFTNDDISSGPGIASSGFGGSLGAGPGQAGQTSTSNKAGTPPTPAQAVERMEATMNMIDSLDRATLVKNVLQGSDS